MSVTHWLSARSCLPCVERSPEQASAKAAERAAPPSTGRWWDAGLPGPGEEDQLPTLSVSGLGGPDVPSLPESQAFSNMGCKKAPGRGTFGSPLWSLPLLPHLSLGGRPPGLLLTWGTCGFWSELGIPSYSDGSFLGALARGPAMHPPLHTFQGLPVASACL